MDCNYLCVSRISACAAFFVVDSSIATNLLASIPGNLCLPASSFALATDPLDADNRGNLLQDLLRRLPQQHTGPNEFRDGYLEYEDVTTGWTALMHAASQVRNVNVYRSPPIASESPWPEPRSSNSD